MPVVTHCGSGACGGTGVTSCVHGHVVDSCMPSGQPTGGHDATCDGVDDDCDGRIDENYVVDRAPLRRRRVRAHAARPAASAATSSDSCTAGYARGERRHLQRRRRQLQRPSRRRLRRDGDELRRRRVREHRHDLCVNGHGAEQLHAGHPGGERRHLQRRRRQLQRPGRRRLRHDDDELRRRRMRSTGTTCASAGTCRTAACRARPRRATRTATASTTTATATIDEGFVSTMTICGVGACAATGMSSCVSGQVVRQLHAGLAGGERRDLQRHRRQLQRSNRRRLRLGADQLRHRRVREHGHRPAASSGAVHDSCTPARRRASDTTCNGIDDNCNGTTDEGYVSTQTSCGVGACVEHGLDELRQRRGAEQLHAGQRPRRRHDLQRRRRQLQRRRSTKATSAVPRPAAWVPACAPVTTQLRRRPRAEQLLARRARRRTTHLRSASTTTATARRTRTSPPTVTHCGVGACAATARPAASAARS